MQLTKQKLGKYKLLAIKKEQVYPLEDEAAIRVSASRIKAKYGISFKVNKVLGSDMNEYILVTRLTKTKQ